MENTVKRQSEKSELSAKLGLLAYTLISAVSLGYLALPSTSGVGVAVFGVIQFVMLFFLAPARKPLLMFIPVFFILSNYLLSANPIWRLSNPFVLLCLYGVMYLWMTKQLPLRSPSMEWLGNLAAYLVVPLKYFLLPFQWLYRREKPQRKILLRLAIALAITIPCLFILVAVLSQADAIFSGKIEYLFENLSHWLNLGTIARYLFGALGGLYLFTLLYAARKPELLKAEREKRAVRSDLLILNVFLAAVLAVYTLFVFIQFKYLFAQSDLPDGLTYSSYARKGFFELLFLSGVNIFLILLSVWLCNDKAGVSKRITQGLGCYLCAVTMVLLASSFYRMWLYSSDDGLTRLRFLVFGFLVFESVGLLVTFFYIFRPRFNIAAVYLGIGLCYYLLLNVVPMDYFVAKSQVDRYLFGQGNGIAYTLTLSEDAAPQIKRLLDSPAASEEAKAGAREYFQRTGQRGEWIGEKWQRFQLSSYCAEKLTEK